MGRYYLLNNPNPNGAFYSRTRSRPLRAIMMHITAGLQDFSPPDPTAELVSRYASTTTRRVSWHASVDSDSIVELLPSSYDAWHVRTYHDDCYGIEICKTTTDWRPGPNAPEPWRTRILANAANIAGDVAEEFDIPIRKITASQFFAGAKGFISHAELDPSRRTDPGWIGRAPTGTDTFPWNLFFRMIRQEDFNVLTRKSQIRRCQKYLTNLGYSPGEADGIVGPRTRRAIKNFCRNNWIAVSSEFDLLTVSVLAAVHQAWRQHGAEGVRPRQAR